jgi:hypothetical protein
MDVFSPANSQVDKIKIISTNEKCCCNCKGHGEDCKKGAWIYCDLRIENEEMFNGDCGETLGCDSFSQKLRT